MIQNAGNMDRQEVSKKTGLGNFQHTNQEDISCYQKFFGILFN
jgi:hypothetical protein